jgi:hypothetical protein
LAIFIQHGYQFISQRGGGAYSELPSRWGISAPRDPILLHAIEHCGSYSATSTKFEGEYFVMAMAQVLPADQVATDKKERRREEKRREGKRY